MILGNELDLRSVSKISPESTQRIADFLQGAVYSWCKNRSDEWFGLRDLVGGDNFFWQGTPLIVIYEKHEDCDDAVQRAGKDCGWLLKSVIHADRRSFETRKAELTRQYKWVRDGTS